ncbi:extracellular solute-binding protein [Amycolatopsis sp. K13G38]|uniref:Extracellular solute-binding protein n=1 Tax=Amycolatopsis acididurans TaxID=2724524 RepID=A0ABX1JB23_9PSEU|nr:extracellular solute-binding protein [Amycolatopsis acididurans]
MLGLAVLMSVVVAGCGGGGFSGSSSDGTGTGKIRVLVNITPNLTQAYWDSLVKPFEDANPGVDVVIEAPTGKSVSDTLQQQLAAGSAPDVVETLMADKTLAPQLLDLTDESWVKGTPLVDQAALDGKIYNVGVGEQAQSLIFYNKQAFAKAGITEMPKTFDELTAAMGKLKAAGYLPMQTSGEYVTGLQVLQMADPSLAQTAPAWHQDIAAGKIKAGESMIPYFKLYQSWIDAGYIDKNALGLKYADAQQQFFSGKSAMFPMGSWFTASVAGAKPGFDVGVIPAPVLNGQSSPGPQGATMAAPYMIMKGTQQKALALKLVQWLVTDQQAVVSQLKQDGNFRSGITRDFTPLEADVQKILDSAPAKVAQGEGYGDATLPRGFNSAFNSEVQGLYIGHSPETVAEGVDRWVGAHK